MDNTLSGTVLSTKLGSGKRKRYVGVYGTEGCSKNGHALALFRRDCSSNGVATTGTPRPTHSVYWHKKLGAEWSHIVRTQGCHCSDCPRACGSMSQHQGPLANARTYSKSRSFVQSLGHFEYAERISHYTDLFICRERAQRGPVCR